MVTTAVCWLTCVSYLLNTSAQDGEGQRVQETLETSDTPAVDAPEFSPTQQVLKQKRAAAYPKVLRYAKYTIAKYDLNGDGILQKDEWKSMHGHPESIAQNDDGSISLSALTKWIADYDRRKRIENSYEQESIPEEAPSTKTTVVDGDESGKMAVSPDNPPLANGERRRDQKFYVPSKRLPAGLPDWFFAKDKDGDGQLTVGEYCTTGGAAELAEFEKFDTNGDGVATAKECTTKAVDKTPAKPLNDALPPTKTDEKTSRNRRKTRTTQ